MVTLLTSVRLLIIKPQVNLRSRVELQILVYLEEPLIFDDFVFAGYVPLAQQMQFKC